MTVAEYASFCAPTALATLLGTSRLEAAQYLLDNGHHAGGGATKNWSTCLEDLGGERVPDEDLIQEDDRDRYDRAMDDYYEGRRRKRPGWTLGRPTVAETLRRFPKGLYVVSTTSHTLVVKDGEVLQDTLPTGSQRARVRFLHRFPSDTEVGLPEAEAQEIAARHERVRAAKAEHRRRRKTLDSFFPTP